jgi:hypothetical protein
MFWKNGCGEVRWETHSLLGPLERANWFGDHTVSGTCELASYLKIVLAFLFSLSSQQPSATVSEG